MPTTPRIPTTKLASGRPPHRLRGAADRSRRQPQQQQPDDEDAHVPPQQVETTFCQCGGSLGLLDGDLLAAGHRTCPRVVAGGAQHAAGNGAVHTQPPGAEDEVPADLRPRGDRCLAGADQQVFSHPSFHSRLTSGNPHIPVNLPRDRGGPGGREHVSGDRPRDRDLSAAGDQVTIDSAVDPHGPRRGVQVTLDGLPGAHDHLLAAAELAVKLVLLGQDRGRHGRQRHGQERDSLHRRAPFAVRCAC
jgi:hypothetical protein